MSFEKVKSYFDTLGMGDRCIDLKESSATVALAAQALGTEEARIAKTMSFLLADKPLIIVVAGVAILKPSAGFTPRSPDRASK